MDGPIAQELTQRTGRNPHFHYVQIGCSTKAVAAMHNFARKQIGKPFSSTGMFRSIIYPRTTTGESWFCAELVAACLKAGGLMSSDSNPGSATPHSLYETYRRQGAIAANPCTLRNHFSTTAYGAPQAPQRACSAIASAARVEAADAALLRMAAVRTQQRDSRRQRSPPRRELCILQHRGPDQTAGSGVLEISLKSLTM